MKYRIIGIAIFICFSIFTGKNFAHIIPFAFFRGSPCTFNGNITINAANVANYTNCGWQIQNGATVTIDTNIAINISRLTMVSGSLLTHTPCSASACTQVNLNIAGDANINSGAVISADGKGYLGGYQSGNANSYGHTKGFQRQGGAWQDIGGAHGGSGAAHGFTNESLVYDDIYQPTDYGGGGGGGGSSGTTSSQKGGNGGGVIRLNINGDLNLDGLISAQGAAAASGMNFVGGGAGGSIWITCNKLSSSTAGIVLSVAGGGADTTQSNTGGGGGGRIAVNYISLGGTMAFTGTRIDTEGGKASGNYYGGFGSFLAKTSAQTYGDLYYFGNGSNKIAGASYVGGSTFGRTTVATTSTVLNYSYASGDWPNLGRIYSTNELVGKKLVPFIDTATPMLFMITANDAAAMTITVSGDMTTAGGSKLWGLDDFQNTFDNVYIMNRTTVVFYKVTALGNFSVDSNARAVGAIVNADTVTVTNNSQIAASYIEFITVNANTLTLDDTSGVIADNAGYASKISNGYSAGSKGASGGSHIGYGGFKTSQPTNTPAVTYDDPLSPRLPGGGGGAPDNYGAFGGGAITLNVSGTLTINGYVSADGAGYDDNNYGGAAGGSILINAGTLKNTSANSPLLTARGGSHDNSGAGGGGGAVAIYYGILNFPSSMTAFNMSKVTQYIRVHGGTSSSSTAHGGPGSVYIKPSAQLNGDLYFDNNNLHESYTSTTPFPQTINRTYNTINLQRGSTVKQYSSVTSISFSTCNVTGSGTTLYIPDNGGTGYNSLWFVGGTVSAASGGSVVEY